MRCLACNVELTDNEAAYQDENGYVDMCGDCIKASSDTSPMEPDYVKESIGLRNEDD